MKFGTRFYVWNVGMYYSLITVLAMSLWAIPAWSHTHDRLAIGVTLVSFAWSMKALVFAIPNVYIYI